VDDDGGGGQPGFCQLASFALERLQDKSPPFPLPPLLLQPTDLSVDVREKPTRVVLREMYVNMRDKSL
jgi:hypothetical protein